MKKLVLVGLLVALAGCKPAPVDGVTEQKEFVCYSDGKLTERHVGVKYTNQSNAGNGFVYISYVDNDVQAIYIPAEGETCFEDEVSTAEAATQAAEIGVEQ